jgi:hypothetical protein
MFTESYVFLNRMHVRISYLTFIYLSVSSPETCSIRNLKRYMLHILHMFCITSSDGGKHVHAIISNVTG